MVCGGVEWGAAADLDCLEGAQEEVGDELGRRGRGCPHQRPILLRRLLPHHPTVPVGRVLVDAVLARALQRVAHEGGRPPLEDAAQAGGEAEWRRLTRVDVAEAADGALAEVLGVGLGVALDHVQRADEGVRGSAGEGAAEAA